MAKHFLQALLGRDAARCVLWNERAGRAVATALESGFDSQSRRKGLLGRTGLQPQGAFILAPCGGVHTAFMQFPIDVLFVKRDGTVLKIREDMRPWRVAIAPFAFATIEMPVGAIEASTTRVGDQLRVSIIEGSSSSEATTVLSQPDSGAAS